MALRAIRGTGEEAFLADSQLQAAAERHLQLAIQAAIDAAAYVLAEDFPDTLRRTGRCSVRSARRRPPLMGIGRSGPDAGGAQGAPAAGARGGPGARGRDVAGGADLREELDDLLDENAEGFVKAYVQKGGE